MSRAHAVWRRLRVKISFVRTKIGRRGSALLFFALLDLIFAAGLVTAPPLTSRSGTYAFLTTILPLWMWAIPWAAVGVLCLVSAFGTRDRAAFVAASGLKVGWGFLFLAGWLYGEIPRGFVSAAIWLGLAGFVAVISGWPEPPPRRR